MRDSLVALLAALGFVSAMAASALCSHCRRRSRWSREQVRKSLRHSARHSASSIPGRSGFGLTAQETTHDPAPECGLDSPATRLSADTRVRSMSFGELVAASKVAAPGSSSGQAGKAAATRGELAPQYRGDNIAALGGFSQARVRQLPPRPAGSADTKARLVSAATSVLLARMARGAGPDAPPAEPEEGTQPHENRVKQSAIQWLSTVAGDAPPVLVGPGDSREAGASAVQTTLPLAATLPARRFWSELFSDSDCDQTVMRV